MQARTEKKYYIITYGCQMNEHDSQKIAGMLEDMGYHKTAQMEDAGLILLNTCVIRENAELKVFGKIGELKKLKRENPDLIIGIGGCMMQSEEAVEEIYRKYPQVDLIFGTHNIHHLPDLLERIARERNRVIEVWDREEGLIPDLPSLREEKYKAWVSIIQGCNNFCSYCIVPYVRGRERSRSLNSIVDEVRTLAADGVIEITLLGQNVNSYGRDLEEKVDFADLLRALDRVDGLERIRFMTSHPRDFSGDLVEVIKTSDKVCEHIHLPVQSGSNRILKLMNRGYNREHYLEIINEIKEEIPHASISTDIIVGFPGETEEDFLQTLELVKKVEFDMAFTFIYSPRKGTPAARKEDQVADQVKKERLNRLMEIQNQNSYKSNQPLLGKTVEVLVEGASKNNPDNFMGRTRTNKLVIFPSREGIIGKLVKVKVNDVSSFTLYGEIV